MAKIQQFYEVIQREMAVLLATAGEDSVTMRQVSPVKAKDGILIFTHADSVKYRQLKANPHCCLAAGGFFAEATASFCGKTMLEENKELREIYSEKFPGAFDEGIAFGGRDAEFLLLKPTILRGWAFENDIPTADGIPTIPFELKID